MLPAERKFLWELLAEKVPDSAFPAADMDGKAPSNVLPERRNLHSD